MFPTDLITARWSSYEEAKARSALIDQRLGFQIEACEISLRGQHLPRQDWSALSEQIFQTPYPEFSQMVQAIESAKNLRWVDFGAAYGRLGIVLSILRPADEFLGCEIVAERVHHARQIYQKLNLNPQMLQVHDLRAGPIPEFDVAFLYDFGTTDQIADFLDRLRQQSAHRSFALFARGRATRHLVETHHSWLAHVEEPRHTIHWSFYRNSSESPALTSLPILKGETD